MNILNWKKVQALFIACACSFTVLAQISSDDLQQFISDAKHMNDADIKHTAEVAIFYTRLNYKTAWIQNENAANRIVFLNDLMLAPRLGLNEKDYQFNYIESFRNNAVRLESKDDSLEAEVRMTDAAVHFYNDIVYGNTKPVLEYNGLKYVSGFYTIPALLTDYISKNTLQLLIAHLTPALPEITVLANKINRFRTVMGENDFAEVTITSNKVSSSNKPLLSKLYQLGIIDSVNNNLPDSVLKQKVKEVQRQFTLPPDGTLRSNIMQQLNIPLSVRLQQLALSLNYYRWLSGLMQTQSVIVVNIPAAYLKVYQKDKILLEMRTIVGKTATPTPTLASSVDEVILYPYWHVPYSIATKELLPSIKRNPGYIDANNYQVLNSAGKIMDPYAIDWHALSASYFPYLIRQSTGCDNALGLLKLNFYSPSGVYLHDTPKKGLFMMNRRFFSHGCMRMEKPMEMGHLVLKNNQIAIDTLEQKGCLRNQKPISVQADEHIPVIVWYNPAGIDAAGRVLFFEDIYGKFEWMKNK
jgi:L,D-transpeptidase YcbB